MANTSGLTITDTPPGLSQMLAAMVARLMRWFVRRGVVVAEAGRAWVEDGLDGQ